MNTTIPLHVYVLLTYLITSYILFNKYNSEKHLFALFLVLVKSKSYLVLIINFIIANYVMVGSLTVKLFFGEIRVSELLGVVDKIKAKLITFMLLFITMRPSVDIYKLMIIIHIYFVLLLNMLAFNRAAYLVTAEATNPNSKKGQRKIFFVHILLFLINYASFIIVSYPLKSSGIDFLSLDYFNFSGMEKGNASEIIVCCIFTTEVIFMQMKLYVKFIKLSIDLTELKIQKEWEHKKVFLHLINLFRYAIKVLIEIKFCALTIKTGVFPIYLFIDGFYSIWHVTKQGYKLWEYISLRRIIKNLEHFDANLSQEGDGETKNQCICLDEVKVGKKLPCGHVFHEACIK